MAGPRRAPLLFREHSETDKLYFVYKIFNKNVNLRHSAADGLLIKVTGRVVAGGLLKIKITFVLLPHLPTVHVPSPTTDGRSIKRRGRRILFTRTHLSLGANTVAARRRTFFMALPPPLYIFVCFFPVHDYYWERGKIIIMITASTTTTTITQCIIVL